MNFFPRRLAILLFARLAIVPITAAEDPPLRPLDLRCETQVDPCGVDEPKPELSWRLESSHRATRQTAWQILVASTPDRLAREDADLWDSGKVTSAETLHIPYGGSALKSSQRVSWKIRVWDEAGTDTPWSQGASWTTGMMRDSDWRARWITAPFTQGLPLLRREFTLSQATRHAVVHLSGLGHVELFLDGTKVGNRFLDPAWTVYEKTVAYASYDLTPLLTKPGPHVLGVMLGKGFYRTLGDRRVHGVNSDRPLRLILQADLVLADGTEQSVASDAEWKFTEGPITHSAILGGEDHDARRLPKDWARPGFDASNWSAAIVTNGPGGRLVGTMSPPLTVRQTFAAVRVEEPEPGRFVYDFGQNASAIPRLRVRGQAGQVVKLTPAEQRHGMTPRRNDGHGLVNPAGVGSPCYFQYTLRGGEEESWNPQFTYSGFQYLEVQGAVPAGHANPAGLPEIVELTSLHVRSSAEDTGEFECSNAMFNDIDRINNWAVAANLSHVLTDCPHREKLGWLEVSYLMGPSMAGRHDIARFFSKIARDCADSQEPNGKIPTVAPAYPAFSGGFAYTPEWGAAAVVNPWILHEWYGDRRSLERSYPMMRGFVDHLLATSTDLVPVPGLGDWYDYGHGKPVGASQFTPPELSAMATFHRCARIVTDAARVLGRTDDARKYGKLTDDVARSFHQHWFDGRGEYRNTGSPQTANAMALVSGIVPKDEHDAVLAAIVRDLEKRRLQQTSGDIGHWYLLQALANNGRSDMIHDIVGRTNLGSYGFIVRNGWTSMPEAWDADTGASMNHCMLGHVQEWFLGWVAGIRPDPEGPGFRQFIIAPEVVGGLTWARGRLDTAHGRIETLWRRTPTSLTLELTVPPNTTASLLLPATEGSTLTESGQDVRQATGVRLASRSGSTARLLVEGGKYRFEVSPNPRP